MSLHDTWRTIAGASPPMFARELPESLQDPSCPYQVAKTHFFSHFVPDCDSLVQEVTVGCDGNVKLNFSVKSHISLFGNGFIEIRQIG